MKWPWVALHSGARNPYVDLLRGFSIFVVLFAHFSATCGPFSPTWVVPLTFVRALGRNSSFAVTLFLAISGYLITTTSIQRFGALGKIRLRDFYVYRASRILPILLLLTAVNLACYYTGMAGFELTPDISVARVLEYLFTFRFNLLYLQGGLMLPAWAVLWSLAIEEVFYLGYPLLCRLLRHDALIVGALIALVIAGPIVRYHEGWTSLYRYEGCFDQLALGCLAGLVTPRLTGWSSFPRLAPVLLAAGLLIVLGFYFARDEHVNAYWVPAPTAIAGGAAIFLLGVSWKSTWEGVPFWAQGRTFRLLGVLSYELYLFHSPLYLVLKHAFALLRSATAGILPRDVAFAAMIPLLLAIGTMLAAGFGQPAQRALRQILSRGSTDRRPAEPLPKTLPDQEQDGSTKATCLQR